MSCAVRFGARSARVNIIFRCSTFVSFVLSFKVASPPLRHHVLTVREMHGAGKLHMHAGFVRLRCAVSLSPRDAQNARGGARDAFAYHSSSPRPKNLHTAGDNSRKKTGICTKSSRQGRMPLTVELFRCAAGSSTASTDDFCATLHSLIGLSGRAG